MNAARFTLEEKVAVVASGAILLGCAVYWGVQIHGVIETLRLAYG